jgi:lipopolysaccharide cholinephosphotransferase
MQELTLDEIKECELQIMKYIKRVCESNDLHYYLAFGTLLGAVRHKGFIPWDDDIDIYMLRDDYNKFIEIMKKEEGNYRLLAREIVDEYDSPLAKVIDSNTVLIQDYGMSESCKLGVYVDVFVIDDIPRNPEKQRKMLFAIQRCLINWHKSKKKIFYEKDSLIQKIWYLISGIYPKIKGSRYWLKQIDQILRNMMGTEKTDVLAELYWGGFRGTKLPVFSKNDFGDGIVVDFEDDAFCIPRNYEKILSAYYKDYMILPPEEERFSNHDYVAYRKE